MCLGYRLAELGPRYSDTKGHKYWDTKTDIFGGISYHYYVIIACHYF